MREHATTSCRLRHAAHLSSSPACINITPVLHVIIRQRVRCVCAEDETQRNSLLMLLRSSFAAFFPSSLDIYALYAWRNSLRRNLSLNLTAFKRCAGIRDEIHSIIIFDKTYQHISHLSSMYLCCVNTTCTQIAWSMRSNITYKSACGKSRNS